MSDRIVLATMGSLGDLHPFIAIAQRLKERGHDPVLATGSHFRENILAAGVRFHAVRPSRTELFEDLRMDFAEFGRRVMKDMLFILHGAVFPYLREMYEDLLPVIDGASLVLTSSLLFSGRLAAEKLGVAHMGVALQPMLFVSAYDPPTLDPARWLAPVLVRLGPGTTGVIQAAAKKLLSQQSAEVLFAFRRDLGLADTDRNPLYEGQFSPHGTLALYSRLLGDIQPDYPPHTTITGFTFHDTLAPDQAALEPGLEQFLSSGAPPLIFTLGSFAVQFAGDFYQVSLDVCRRLGERAVLLAGEEASALRAERRADVWVADYAPFSRLFPRARAVIHQGGIGTVGQALRAGKPQLVVPFHSDQYDNAARVVRLGAGRSVPRARYNSRRLAAELGTLLGAAGYASRAAALGPEVAREDGAGAAVRVIEHFLSTR
jgi:UDP:flavonoid glycosyltransferase YjiC (YdhE family)